MNQISNLEAYYGGLNNLPDKMWEQAAVKYYYGTDKFKKALAAGKAMDNALDCSYSKGGTTKCHFMVENWLKYFDR